MDVKLSLKRVPSCPADLPEGLEDYLCLPYEEHGDGYWWEARDPETEDLLAFCGLDHLTSTSAFLSRSWVSPEHRGKGWQKKMIRTRERFARSLSVSRLVTYTTHCNPASSNSLIRCGYKLYTPEDPWGCPGANYWYRLLNPTTPHKDPPLWH